MVVYRAAILEKVQLVLGRETPTPEAVIALDRYWRRHKNGGVYVDLAYTKSSNDHACYIGSTTREFSKRIRGRLRILNKYTIPSKTTALIVGDDEYAVCRNARYDKD
jgi:hypothetical protein